ncbi:MAG TPA: adenylate/guanylate cyclase domain-containing protein [Xanthobacteraceae bacterium]|nr:adenylate/guanylate cyclase domain-containing protein [Xanthobacteraceae bacterium]
MSGPNAMDLANCPRCGANLPRGKKFCGDCGLPLPWQCATCGAQNPAGKKFCGDCGTALLHATPVPQDIHPVPAATPMAERRHLTVMFADLVGSTELSARLDPEDLRHVLADYRGCATELIARFGGFVARYVGDGVLVYFGYPRAQEDDPERAVRAGLAIVEAVGCLETIAGPAGTLRVHVGIATGLVVVGDLIGSGPSLESSVVGDTPNLAARLEAVAEPGMVVIAETTRNLVGGLFEYRALSPMTLKGLRAPVRAWAVLAEVAIESRFEALHAGYVPLVDRVEEFDLLFRRWEQTRAGEGRVVLLSGEPGIGKSRLIAALEQKVGATGRTRRYLCLPQHQDTALYPVISQFERIARFERGDPPASKLGKLQNALLAASASPIDTALFADLLSIPNSDAQLLEGLTPRRKKELTFEAMTRQFHQLAARGPTLIVLEDIHWADPTTLDFLEMFVETVAAHPMLLVVTTRPEALPTWATRPHVTVQLLNALPRSYAESLITEVAESVRLPGDVVERILAHADGVPLFIEELTKTVLDRGASRKDGERANFGAALSADLVPATLQASLMARLDRLSTCKDVAQIGSVIGREFSFELVKALAGLPDQRLVEALDELVESGLVTVRGQPPEAAYLFKHALIQDAAYASLLRERRRAIHLRLAEALEKDPMASTEPQLLARHFAEAGQPDKAIDCYLQAAERATGRFALGEMVSCLRDGLRQLERLPDSLETKRRELALQVSLGRVLVDHQGGGGEQVRTAFERAREICLELGETNQLIPIHDGLTNYHFAHFELNEVLRYVEEMREVGRRAGNPQAVLMAHRSGGFANLLLGRLADAARDLRLLIETYEQERDGPHSAFFIRDPKVSACTALGTCLSIMGFPDSGTVACQEGVAHAERLNHPVSLTLGLRRACGQRVILRDVAGVVATSKRLLEVSAEYETFKGSRDGTIFHCWGELHTKWDPVSLDRLLACVEELDTARNWVMLPFYMASAAEVRGAHGDRDGAVVLLERAAELTSITGERWCEPEVTRLTARFGARDDDEAVALLQSALATAKGQGAKLWWLRAATDLARLWQRTGEAKEASAVLAPIYGWFTEGLELPDLVAARALVDDLGRGAQRR